MQILKLHSACPNGDGHVSHAADSDPAITSGGERKRPVHSIDPQRPRVRGHLDSGVTEASEVMSRLILDSDIVRVDLGFNVNPLVLTELVAKPQRLHRLAITATPTTQLQTNPFGREDGKGHAPEDVSILGLPFQLPVRLLALTLHDRIVAQLSPPGVSA